MKTAATQFALIAGLVLASLPAKASLQAYWNMDAATISGKLQANAGDQAASLTESTVFFDFGTASQNATPTGTTVNILGDAPVTNYAVGFTDPISAALAFEFRVDNFNFSNLTDVVMTFAVENYTVAIANAFTIETRIGNGGWDTDYAEVVTGSGDYQLATVSFGSDLDHESEPVDIRIRYVAIAEGISYLNIDNIQVNAVPEPTTWAAILGCGVLGFTFWRRRKA